MVRSWRNTRLTSGCLIAFSVSKYSESPSWNIVNYLHSVSWMFLRINLNLFLWSSLENQSSKEHILGNTWYNSYSSLTKDPFSTDANYCGTSKTELHCYKTVPSRPLPPTKITFSVIWFYRIRLDYNIQYDLIC